MVAFSKRWKLALISGSPALSMILWAAPRLLVHFLWEFRYKNVEMKEPSVDLVLNDLSRDRKLR